MTDYTSDEEHLLQHYRELSETVSGEASVGEQNVKVARRTLAKIKADALREFVSDAQDLINCSGDTRWVARALARADLIEGEHR